MANAEYLEILMGGVKHWNTWRKKNPKIKIDLHRANLGLADLSGANLSGVNLRGADLSDARLSNADLNGADLMDADLRDADLRDADLSSADLLDADLSGVYLMDADLSGANLLETDLRGADLRDAILSGARLSDANLSNAILCGANLMNADLSYADLRGADLSNANLTGVNLNGAARFDWEIKGIKCDYVYFDKNFDEKWKERTPKDRNFEQGEFEKLYSEVPTIEIEFGEGITLMGVAVLEHVTRKILEERPDLQLRFIAVDAKGLYPKTRFEIRSMDQGDEVKYLIVQGFQQVRQDQQKYGQIIAQTILGELRGLGDDVRGQLRVIKQDVKTLPGEFKRQLDTATQKILDQAGIPNSEVMQLAEQIRSNETAIQQLSQLRDSDINEIEDIKERLSWLKPYFEKVFNKKFDTTGTKVIRAVFKAVSTHLAGDFLGDQTDLKL